MAFIDLGIRPDEFWRLTIYEWSLCVARINKLYRDEERHRNLLIELERNSMALLANCHRDPKKSRAYTGRDFYTLPGDPSESGGRKMTGEEAFPLMLERFKNKPLRKNG